jgi:hypothetical protein
MIFSNDRRGSVRGVVLGVFAFFVILILVNGGYGIYKGGDPMAEFKKSIDISSKVFSDVLSLLFGKILGLDGTNGNLDMLMILAFSLVSIVLVSALDGSEIFGNDNKAKFTNFVVGIIVAIIGVRFMPEDMWFSLTAPPTALVATIIMVIMFGGVFIVAKKFGGTNPFIHKLIWLFFIVFLSYVVLFPDTAYGGSGGSPQDRFMTTDFSWIYLVFLVLSIVMMYFDSQVMDFIGKEKAKMNLRGVRNERRLLNAKRMRDEIIAYDEVRNDPNASSTDREAAKTKIEDLQKDLEALYSA